MDLRPIVRRESSEASASHFAYSLLDIKIFSPSGFATAILVIESSSGSMGSSDLAKAI